MPSLADAVLSRPDAELEVRERVADAAGATAAATADAMGGSRSRDRA